MTPAQQVARAGRSGADRTPNQLQPQASTEGTDVLRLPIRVCGQSLERFNGWNLLLGEKTPQHPPAKLKVTSSLKGDFVLPAFPWRMKEQTAGARDS